MEKPGKRSELRKIPGGFHRHGHDRQESGTGQSYQATSMSVGAALGTRKGDEPSLAHRAFLLLVRLADLSLLSHSLERGHFVVHAKPVFAKPLADLGDAAR
jgi:hypothetical protein